MKEYLNDLRERLCKELEEIAMRRDMSAGDLETLHKLTDTIKNIDKIEMLEDGGYSQRGGRGYGGEIYYRGDMSYDEGGNSYRERNRDSRGRYSRESGRRGYSRDDGKHEMIKQLEEMMGDADTEREREAFRRCIEVMRGT